MTAPFAITPPGGAEWIVILAIVVLLFGAKKLPELGGSVGKSIREFKKGVDEGKGAETAEEAASDAAEKSSSSEQQ
jgi:sec-independent protein translocase protein TatA